MPIMPKLTNWQTQTLTPAAWASEHSQFQQHALKLAS